MVPCLSKNSQDDKVIVIGYTQPKSNSKEKEPRVIDRCYVYKVEEEQKEERRSSEERRIQPRKYLQLR
jgi:hypothetical protein